MGVLLLQEFYMHTKKLPQDLSLHFSHACTYVGNNDGPHDAIFVSGGTDNDTIAWADVVVGAGVVTDALGITYDSNLTQIDFYR